MANIPEKNNGKFFLALGTDHCTSVGETLTGILTQYKVEAITLESGLNLFREKDRIHDYPRGRDRLLVGDGIPFKTTVHKDGITLTAAGLCVYGWPGEKNKPESEAAIRFALANQLPFYFIERDWEFEDSIFQFKDERLRVLSLEGLTTYRNHPDKRLRIDPDGDFNSDSYGFSVPARNLFAADALRFLFGRYNRIAHIGGIAHFDASFKPDLTDGWSDLFRLLPDHSLELQNLVPADRIVVYNLVTGKQF